MMRVNGRLNRMDEKADERLEDYTPTERLKKFVAANARDDIELMERLKNTCPRGTYEIPDPVFMDRLNGLQTAMILFSGLWYQSQAALNTARIQRRNWEAIGEASRRAFVSGMRDVCDRADIEEPPEVAGLTAADFEDVLCSNEPEIIGEDIRAAQKELLAVYRAADDFVSEVDIDFWLLVNWSENLAESVESELAEIPGDIEPDPGIRSKIRRVLMHCWPTA